MSMMGCSFDAERDNPLDPHSPDYQPEVPPKATLKGKVTRLDTTIALPEVYIFLSPGSRGTTSGSDGTYMFSELDSGSFTLVLEHPDYQGIIDELELSSGDTLSRSYAMNAHPQFDSVSITSQRIRTQPYSYEHYYQMLIFAQVSDPDGNSQLSDSAFVFWNNEVDTLIREGGTSNYIAILSENRFPGGDIENMLGVQFEITVSDIQGDTARFQFAQLARVIETQMVFDSPPPNSPFTEIPDFSWRVPQVVFDYKYRFKLFNEDTRQLLLEEVLYDTSQSVVYDSIAGLITYSIEEYTLEVGNYYWTIQFEDVFGDFSRSTDLPFEIY